MQSNGHQSMYYRLFRATLSGCALSLGVLTHAQQAPAAAASPNATDEKDEVITLSPFEVHAESDQGYVATNTLAGSRLNTSLRDTPASISVMTKDFLNDIAAISVTDAMEYSLNASNDISGGSTNNRGDTGNGLIENDFNFQVRGYRQATQTRNYFITPLDGDTYNIERIDVARGPNSLLFGVGGPSGVINTTTKRADPTRNFGTLTTRIGSYSMLRTALDANMGLLDGKLGLRTNLLHQNAEGYHEFESDDQKRGALAVTIKPVDGTMIRLGAERGWMLQNRVRPWTAVDRYTHWEHVGSPVYAFGTPQSPAGLLAPIQSEWVVNDQNFSQAQNTSNLGGMNNGLPLINPDSTGRSPEIRTGQNGNYNFFTDGPLAGKTLFTGGDSSLGGGPGSFRGARYIRVSSAYANEPGFDTPFPIIDESVYPRTGNIAGPGQYTETDYSVLTASIEQRVGKNLYLEFIANRTVRDFENRTTLGFGQIGVQYDATSSLPTFLPDGSYAASLGGPTTTGQGRGALNFGQTYTNLLTGEVEANPVGGGLITNPNLGKILSYWNPSYSTTETTLDDLRFSASYHLDLGAFGDHNLLAFVSRSESDRETKSYRMGNVAPNRASDSMFTNIPGVISHVDPFSANQAERGLPNPWTSNLLQPDTARIYGRSSVVPGQPYTEEFYQPAMVQSNWTSSNRKIDSMAVATHSSFFERSLILTGGVRRDTIEVFNGEATLDPVTQEAVGLNVLTTPAIDVSGDTYSAGAVYHLPFKRFDWLSVFANQATNFQDQNARRFEDEALASQSEIGPLKGLGRDYGLKARLFDGRINATLTRFTVEQTNVAVGVGSGNVGTYINAIWTTIQNNGPETVQTDVQNPTGHHIGGFDTRSQVSEGWEFEVTANPTRNWRVSFNVSKSDNVLSDLGSNFSAYLEKHRAEWQSKAALNYDTGLSPGFLNNAGGSNNIGALLYGLDNVFLPFAKASEGVSEINIRPWNANAFTAYTFDEGFLAGLTVGGGVNYRGDQILGIRPPTVNDPTYEVFQGGAYYLVNAMLRYDFKAWKKHHVSLQLNVNNLLDYDNLQVLSSNYSTATQTIGKWYYHLEPRTYSLSATLSF